MAKAKTSKKSTAKKSTTKKAAEKKITAAKAPAKKSTQKKTTSIKTKTKTSAPNNDAVAAKAYEIWEREGRPEGRAEAHWAMALEELSH